MGPSGRFCVIEDPPARFARVVAIRFTQVIAPVAAWWGGPPGPRGTPRPAAGSGGRGLRAGEGARPTNCRESAPTCVKQIPHLRVIGGGQVLTVRAASRDATSAGTRA